MVRATKWHHLLGPWNNMHTRFQVIVELIFQKINFLKIQNLHEQVNFTTLFHRNPLLVTMVLLLALQFLNTIPLPGRGIPPLKCDS